MDGDEECLLEWLAKGVRPQTGFEPLGNRRVDFASSPIHQLLEAPRRRPASEATIALGAASASAGWRFGGTRKPDTTETRPHTLAVLEACTTCPCLPATGTGCVVNQTLS